MKPSFTAMEAFWLAFLASTTFLRAGDSIKATAFDWTVSGNTETGSLTIEHRRWGIVLEDVQLHLREAQGMRPLTSWTAASSGTNQIVVRTSNSTSTWVFDLSDGALRVSCTSPDGVLTGRTPASRDRLIARILDPEGVPVVWQGTGEVASG